MNELDHALWLDRFEHAIDDILVPLLNEALGYGYGPPFWRQQVEAAIGPYKAVV